MIFQESTGIVINDQPDWVRYAYFGFVAGIGMVAQVISNKKFRTPKPVTEKRYWVIIACTVLAVIPLVSRSPKHCVISAVIVIYCLVGILQLRRKNKSI